MIRMTIDIGLPAPGEARNEFGAGVRVLTVVERGIDIPDGVGATFVGLSTAINDYMRSRGCPGFDCLQPQPTERTTTT